MFFLRKLFRRDTQPLTDGTTPPAGDRPVAVEAPHEHEDAQPGGASQDQAAAPYDAAGGQPLTLRRSRELRTIFSKFSRLSQRGIHRVL